MRHLKTVKIFFPERPHDNVSPGPAEALDGPAEGPIGKKMKFSHKILSWIFTRESRMLRASLPSSGRPSVRPSVCLSVTLVDCIKTVQARITKSSLWAAPRSLVYREKISSHWVQGFPSNEGVEEGYPLKDVILPLLARIKKLPVWVAGHSLHIYCMSTC